LERQVAAHAGADGVVVASTSIAARGHLAPQPAPNYGHHTDRARALLYIERWLSLRYASALGKTANCQTLVSLTLARGEVPVATVWTASVLLSRKWGRGRSPDLLNWWPRSWTAIGPRCRSNILLPVKTADGFITAYYGKSPESGVFAVTAHRPPRIGPGGEIPSEIKLLGREPSFPRGWCSRSCGTQWPLGPDPRSGRTPPGTASGPALFFDEE